MRLRAHLGMRLSDLSVRADDVGDPARGRRLRVVGRPVGDSDLAAHVTEERKRVVELLRERRVLVEGVERDAQDLGVLLLKAGVEVAEPATLGRSAGSVGLWIEPEHDRAPPVVRKPARAPRVVSHGKLGGGGSYGEHRRLPPQRLENSDQDARPSQVSRDSSYAGSSTGQPLRSNRRHSQTRDHFRKTPQDCSVHTISP